MPKPKQQYLIYSNILEDSTAWDGTSKEEKTQIGVTWAVSEAQAINNFCYRNKIRKFEVLDEWGDCATFRHITAELAANNAKNAAKEEQLMISI